MNQNESADNGSRQCLPYQFDPYASGTKIENVMYESAVCEGDFHNLHRQRDALYLALLNARAQIAQQALTINKLQEEKFDIYNELCTSRKKFFLEQTRIKEQLRNIESSFIHREIFIRGHREKECTTKDIQVTDAETQASVCVEEKAVCTTDELFKKKRSAKDLILYPAKRSRFLHLPSNGVNNDVDIHSLKNAKKVGAETNHIDSANVLHCSTRSKSEQKSDFIKNTLSNSKDVTRFVSVISKFADQILLVLKEVQINIKHLVNFKDMFVSSVDLKMESIQAIYNILIDLICSSFFNQVRKDTLDIKLASVCENLKDNKSSHCRSALLEIKQYIPVIEYLIKFWGNEKSKTKRLSYQPKLSDALHTFDYEKFHLGKMSRDMHISNKKLFAWLHSEVDSLQVQVENLLLGSPQNECHKGSMHEINVQGKAALHIFECKKVISKYLLYKKFIKHLLYSTMRYKRMFGSGHDSLLNLSVIKNHKSSQTESANDDTNSRSSSVNVEEYKGNYDEIIFNLKKELADIKQSYDMCITFVSAVKIFTEEKKEMNNEPRKKYTQGERNFIDINSVARNCLQQLKYYAQKPFSIQDKVSSCDLYSLAMRVRQEMQAAENLRMTLSEIENKNHLFHDAQNKSVSKMSTSEFNDRIEKSRNRILQLANELIVRNDKTNQYEASSNIPEIPELDEETVKNNSPRHPDITHDVNKQMSGLLQDVIKIKDRLTSVLKHKQDNPLTKNHMLCDKWVWTDVASERNLSSKLRNINTRLQNVFEALHSLDKSGAFENKYLFNIITDIKSNVISDELLKKFRETCSCLRLKNSGDATQSTNWINIQIFFKLLESKIELLQEMNSELNRDNIILKSECRLRNHSGYSKETVNGMCCNNGNTSSTALLAEKENLLRKVEFLKDMNSTLSLKKSELELTIAELKRASLDPRQNCKALSVQSDSHTTFTQTDLPITLVTVSVQTKQGWDMINETSVSDENFATDSRTWITNNNRQTNDLHIQSWVSNKVLSTSVPIQTDSVLTKENYGQNVLASTAIIQTDCSNTREASAGTDPLSLRNVFVQSAVVGSSPSSVQTDISMLYNGFGYNQSEKHRVVEVASRFIGLPINFVSTSIQTDQTVCNETVLTDAQKCVADSDKKCNLIRNSLIPIATPDKLSRNQKFIQTDLALIETTSMQSLVLSNGTAIVQTDLLSTHNVSVGADAPSLQNAYVQSAPCNSKSAFIQVDMNTPSNGTRQDYSERNKTSEVALNSVYKQESHNEQETQTCLKNGDFLVSQEDFENEIAPIHNDINPQVNQSNMPISYRSQLVDNVPLLIDEFTQTDISFIHKEDVQFVSSTNEKHSKKSSALSLVSNNKSLMSTLYDRCTQTEPSPVEHTDIVLNDTKHTLHKARDFCCVSKHIIKSTSYSSSKFARLCSFCGLNKRRLLGRTAVAKSNSLFSVLPFPKASHAFKRYSEYPSIVKQDHNFGMDPLISKYAYMPVNADMQLLDMKLLTNPGTCVTVVELMKDMLNRISAAESHNKNYVRNNLSRNKSIKDRTSDQKKSMHKLKRAHDSSGIKHHESKQKDATVLLNRITISKTRVSNQQINILNILNRISNLKKRVLIEMKKIECIVNRTSIGKSDIFHQENKVSMCVAAAEQCLYNCLPSAAMHPFESDSDSEIPQDMKICAFNMEKPRLHRFYPHVHAKAKDTGIDPVNCLDAYMGFRCDIDRISEVHKECYRKIFTLLRCNEALKHENDVMTINLRLLEGAARKQRDGLYLEKQEFAMGFKKCFEEIERLNETVLEKDRNLLIYREALKRCLESQKTENEGDTNTQEFFEKVSEDLKPCWNNEYARRLRNLRESLQEHCSDICDKIITKHLSNSNRWSLMIAFHCENCDSRWDVRHIFTDFNRSFEAPFKLFDGSLLSLPPCSCPVIK